MIENERQYRITRAQAEKFSQALEEAGARTATTRFYNASERMRSAASCTIWKKKSKKYENGKGDVTD